VVSSLSSFSSMTLTSCIRVKSFFERARHSSGKVAAFRREDWLKLRVRPVLRGGSSRLAAATGGLGVFAQRHREKVERRVQFIDVGVRPALSDLSEAEVDTDILKALETLSRATHSHHSSICGGAFVPVFSADEGRCQHPHHSLGSLNAFVQAAEARNFTVAGRQLGVSSSAIGKAVSRMEERLGVRLFHRSTRSITLTAEGALFLERCRRIFSEIEAAELELSQMQEAPRGTLRVSLPLVGMLMMPSLVAFMRTYPEITLDLDSGCRCD
jgi:Bacterial regulatory helix-turn-helix protein, lysR family